MKKIILLGLFVISTFCQASDYRFDIDGAKLSAVLKVIYQEAFKDKSFALDSAVLSDERPVVFRYVEGKKGFREFFTAYLDSLGYSIQEVGRVDLVIPKKKTELLDSPDTKLFIYRPNYRDSNDLITMLSPMFKGRFLGAVSFTDTELKTNSVVTDSLIYAGSENEVKTLEKLVQKLDFRVPQIEVKSVLFEVSNTSAEGSALKLVASLLSGRLSLDFGGAVQKNTLSVKLSDFEAVVSALSSDDRFKVLSSPYVRVNSGASASFTVGEDVPVLGAVTYSGPSGQPVQSVEYKSSGVIFTVSPKIREAVIEMQINQQISSFIQTTTGVNSSPTLTKRQLATVVSLLDGEAVILGGLKQNKEAVGRSGVSFLPFLDSKSDNRSDTDIILFLQATRI